MLDITAHSSSTDSIHQPNGVSPAHSVLGNKRRRLDHPVTSQSSDGVLMDQGRVRSSTPIRAVRSGSQTRSGEGEDVSLPDQPQPEMSQPPAEEMDTTNTRAMMDGVSSTVQPVAASTRTPDDPHTTEIIPGSTIIANPHSPPLPCPSSYSQPDPTPTPTSPTAPLSKTHARTLTQQTHLTRIWPPDWPSRLQKAQLHWKGYNSLSLLVRMDKELVQPGDGREERMSRVLGWIEREGRGRNRVMRVRAKGQGKGKETIAPTPTHLDKRTKDHPPWPPRPTHRIPLQFSGLRQPGTKGRIDWVFQRDGGCEVHTNDDASSARPADPPGLGGGWERKIRLQFEVPQEDEDRFGMGMAMDMEEEEEEDSLIQFSLATWDLPPLLPSSLPGSTNTHLTRLLGTVLASAIETTPDPERTTFICQPKGKCGEVLKMYENETRIRPRIGVFWTGTEGPLGGRRGLIDEHVHEDEHETGPEEGGERQKVYLASIDETGGWTRLANEEEGQDHSSLIDRMFLSHYPSDSTIRDTFSRALKAVLHSPHRLTGIRLEVPARTGRVDRYLRRESHLNSARQQHEDLVFALGMDRGSIQEDTAQWDLTHKAIISSAGSVDLREPRLLGNVITVCSGYVLFLAERSGGADRDPTDEMAPWEVGLLGPDSSVVVPFNQKIMLYHLTDSFILDSRWNHATMANIWYNCLHSFDERLKDQEWAREIVRSLELMIQTWHKDKTESTRWVREGIKYYSKRCPRQIKREVERLLEGFENKVAQAAQDGRQGGTGAG